MDDLISRQAAIDAMGERPLAWTGEDYELGCRNQYDTDRLAIETVPSAQPELCESIEDILKYLDDVLHPIVSQEHWNVYSELHDMISSLPSAQPKTGKWIEEDEYGDLLVCSECGFANEYKDNYCSNCGARMLNGGE